MGMTSNKSIVIVTIFFFFLMRGNKNEKFKNSKLKNDKMAHFIKKDITYEFFFGKLPNRVVGTTV